MYDVISDERILDLYLQRDTSALVEVTSKYEDYCQKIVYGIWERETIAKECFREALHESWYTIPPEKPKNLKIYLGRLARDHALKYLKDASVDPGCGCIDEILSELGACTEGKDTGKEAAPEILEALNNFLAKLGFEDRRIFVQRYWYCRSLQAVAAISDLSEKVVWTRLSKTRNTLKDTLGSMEKKEDEGGKLDLLNWIGKIEDRFISEAETPTDDLKNAFGRNNADATTDRSDLEENADRGKDPETRKKRFRWDVVLIGAAAIALFVLFIVRMQNRGDKIPKGEIAINEDNFPDRRFRDYVLGSFDRNDDEKLSFREREVVRVIFVSHYQAYVPKINFDGDNDMFYNIVNMNSSLDKISTLKGIEFFPNLETLECTDNALTELDLSSNKALKKLDCSRNLLSSLDLSKNEEMNSIDCSKNPLKKLKLGDKPYLSELLCYSGQLKSLDLNNAPRLDILMCHDNQLTKLNVKELLDLDTFMCYDNQIKELDLSENKILRIFSCANNKLTDLDLSENPALRWVDCAENELKSMKLGEKAKLECLGCEGNQLTEVDAGGASVLSIVEADEGILRVFTDRIDGDEN